MVKCLKGIALLVSLFLVGCKPADAPDQPDQTVDLQKVADSSLKNSILSCRDGVEYLMIETSGGFTATPHLLPNNTVALCHQANKELVTRGH